MKPEELSKDLREGGSNFLNKRRAIAALDFVAMGALGVISLYQLGIIKKIPEPPWKGLDAEKVNGSKEAYSYFSVPDAFLGIASYAVTASLAAAGPQDRSKTQPWWPVAMTGKVLLDAAQAGKLTIDQGTKYRAFCLWCLIAAGATFATVPLAWKEGRAAWKQIG